METIKFHPVLPESGVEIFTTMVTGYLWSVLIGLKEIELYFKIHNITF